MRGMNMDNKEIISRIDHTELRREAVWEDIRKLCNEAREHHTASICIPPFFVKQAKEYVGDDVAICTVIGFPNGYNTTNTKLSETREMIENGADEIDMVINMNMVKEGHFEDVLEEVSLIKKACGDRILKVIIETCLLDEEEKIRLCHVVTKAGADYIKTSTGFSASGATVEDVNLLRANVGKAVKVKAAGGIHSREEAIDMIEAGADRLGTSSLLYKVI